ncbi:MAG: CDP-diacylglycerol--glycerol-3-phosphate 3-phosphatidyltransferase [Parachlamydia sp.]|nr:CDP-diacylglycerol--glycerol-3-phosphate 3-phosphatidyltransferase [Parachlamydia sp.]
MSLPNFLTFFRIFISPIFLLVYLQYESLNIPLIALPYLLLFLLGISELSDAFDGYIARKYNQVTDFGKLFDPMADSIYRTSVFLTFTLPPISLPVFIIFVFIYRDSVISTLRTICALKGYALAARPSGKIKAVVQAAASISILLLFIPYTLGTLHAEALQRNSMLIAGGAAAYAFLSGLDYLYANRDYILKLLTTQKNAIEIRDQ